MGINAIEIADAKVVTSVTVFPPYFCTKIPPRISDEKGKGKIATEKLFHRRILITDLESLTKYSPSRTMKKLYLVALETNRNDYCCRQSTSSTN